MRVATVFSGIGSIEQAVKRVYGEEKLDIVFACDNGERTIEETKEDIEKITKEFTEENKQEYVKKLYLKNGKKNHVKASYFANYGIDEKSWFEDIRFIKGNDYKNQIDLLVGGSPCQSFSVCGKRAGLEDARGTLFYDYAKLIVDTKPNVFIYENVPGMLSHDNGKTWEHIKEIFNSLGYKIFIKVLDSSDYGIPQHRKRIYVVGFKDNNIDFKFPEPLDLKIKAQDLFENNIEDKYYFKEKGFKFVSTNTHRARINRTIIQTQKANQQFNWNGDFVFEPYNKNRHQPAINNGAYKGLYNGKEGLIRKMTPRECLRLMGYDDDFKIVVSDVEAYRQSGNSIVVNVLEQIMIKVKEVLTNGED